MTKQLNLLLIGPQGSGKSIQAAKIIAQYKIPYVATGAMFRDHIEQGTALGKQIESLMKEGTAVSDEISFQVVKERLSMDDAKNAYLLDGFPRNVHQADQLKTITTLFMVIYLKLDDAIAIERLSNRRVCVGCKEIWNLVTKPSKQEGICNTCGGKLEQREDDTEEAVKKRLAWYHKDTAPLLEYYKDIMVTIDGAPTIDEVFLVVDKEIQKKLN